MPDEGRVFPLLGQSACNSEQYLDRRKLRSIDRLVYGISILPTGQLHLQVHRIQTRQCRKLVRIDRVSIATD
jgi:hypothetical protein